MKIKLTRQQYAAIKERYRLRASMQFDYQPNEKIDPEKVSQVLVTLIGLFFVIMVATGIWRGLH